MPRRPQLKKETVTVWVNNEPVRVILHPPTARRRAWYAYWPGLKYSVSTHELDLEKAMFALRQLVEPAPADKQTSSPLSDEEFELVQRTHFGQHSDSAARVRADKTLKDCMQAIRAFR